MAVAGIIIAVGMLDTQWRMRGRLPGRFWIVPQLPPPLVSSIIAGTNGIIQIEPGGGEVVVRHLGGGLFAIDFDRTKVLAVISTMVDTADVQSTTVITRSWQAERGRYVRDVGLYMIHIVVQSKDAYPVICQAFADEAVTSGTIVRCPRH